MNNILLVEDNVDDEVLTLRVLKKNNLAETVNVARDGTEAIDYLFGIDTHDRPDAIRIPDLILLDLNLPKLSGLEVLHQVRTNTSTKLLPVVILTTSSENEDIQASYELGANSFIRKPADFNQFSDAVNQLAKYWLCLNERPCQLAS
jgi:two-component system response regulator